mgnify:CR=1 FL=1
MRLNGTVFSDVLNMDTGITIVTPGKLDRNEEYNIAYLLHGLRGNNRSWLDYSMLSVYANTGNTIYVLPEVGRSFYTDMQYGQSYFTYITEELPQICMSVFNISSDREHTAIMGCSMGGYGALKCAMSKPEQYGMCGAFSSGGVFMKEGLDALRKNGLQKEFLEHFGEQLLNDFKSMFGDSYEYRAECDVIELASRLSEQEIRPKFYITCGTKDYFYYDHVKFCKIMTDIGIDFVHEEWEDSHNHICFNEALRRAIEKFSL